MKQWLLLSFAVAVLTFLSDTAFALRCGSDLVEAGDLKFKVLQACGEPISKEIIGHIDQKRYVVLDENDAQKIDSGEKEIIERIRVMLIEEWIILQKRQYYSLIFEGNALKSIEWIK